MRVRVKGEGRGARGEGEEGEGEGEGEEGEGEEGEGEGESGRVTWMGATRGGRTRPWLSAWTMTITPIDRVVKPHDVCHGICFLPAGVHVGMRACGHACMWACVHVGMRACGHACLWACVPVCMHACTCAYMHL